MLLPTVNTLSTSQDQKKLPGDLLTYTYTYTYRTFLDLSNWHFTTETCAYSEGCGFFRKKFRWKKTPPPAKSLFKNTMGSQKFYLYHSWSKRYKKKSRIEIWSFLFQICFWNQFPTLGSGQTENAHNSHNALFFSLTTSRSRKLIPKTDLKWEGPYLYSNFCSWSVSIKNEKSKFFESRCIFKKVISQGGGSFLRRNFFSEKAKTLGICPCFSGKVPIAQIQKCPVSPPATSGAELVKISKDLFI